LNNVAEYGSINNDLDNSNSVFFNKYKCIMNGQENSERRIKIRDPPAAVKCERLRWSTPL